MSIQISKEEQLQQLKEVAEHLRKRTDLDTMEQNFLKAYDFFMKRGMEDAKTDN